MTQASEGEKMENEKKEELFQKFKVEFGKTWEKFEKSHRFLKEDSEKLQELNDVFKKDEHGHKIVHKEENQFPLPINGNFMKADFLLLYSNPSCEEVSIENYKDDLIKCFKLEEGAKLVVPNEWNDWYTTQLKKFYSGADSSFDLEKFGENFCFINYFPYATKSDTFSFGKRDMKTIKELKSTEFIEALVKLGMEMQKKVFVMRLTRGVWLGNFFDVKDSN